tara:strand:- start:518 stop:703 length:186 start_codon:yes stop_codon:yes gene_type:complete
MVIPPNTFVLDSRQRISARVPGVDPTTDGRLPTCDPSSVGCWDPGYFISDLERIVTGDPIC